MVGGCLLLFIVVYCCLLLFIVVCCCLLLLVTGGDCSGVVLSMLTKDPLLNSSSSETGTTNTLPLKRIGMYTTAPCS